MKKVIIVGSGGHAKVVIDILNEMDDIEIIGITSNSMEAGADFLNYPILGDDRILVKYANKKNYYAAMGLGGYRDNILRKKIFNGLKEQGINFLNVVHPSTTISKSAIIGEGVVVFPGVVINAEVQIGNNSIIATGSTIDHETIIGNHVLVSAGVTVGAYTKIEDEVLLALGSKVISGINIGHGSLVAAGSVVIGNVEKNKKVYGIPAKEKKQLEIS